MRIAILGAGGVGAYLGARLAHTGAADVHLVARGSHLEALQRDGLELRSILGDVRVDIPAYAEPAEIGPVDVVVFTVKSTDTDEAAGRLAPLLGKDTAVISFQNGVDNEERIAAVVGDDHVLGGAAFIFSTITEPGVIHHTGGPARFFFGELDGSPSERATRFLDACREADVDTELSLDIRSLMWRKFVFICAQAGMTAATRLPVGALREDAEAWKMYRQIVEEVCAVAAAEGIPLSNDVVEETMRLAGGLDPDAYSSLHYDLEHGKPMELEALTGCVVALGRRSGVDVPANEAIYALLSPWAARNRARSA
ncbi:MAG: 2-dehydropantoate 2-reductase [Actinomycetota bacterium]